MVKKIIQILISLFVFGLCLFLATLADTNIVSDNFSLKMLIFYIFLIQWLVFVPCFILRTEKIYDLTGSFSYVFAIIYVLYNSSQSIPNLILGAAIIFWAVRLGFFLFFRIKKAVEELFDVKVESVTTSTQKGKTKRNRFGVYKRSDYKNAFVSLKEGSEIQFEGIS